MIKELSVVEFRRHLSKTLDCVQSRNESIVITRRGQPIAALVSVDLFALIRRMHDRFDELSRRIATDFEPVPMVEGIAEIDAAVNAERHR